MYQGIIKTIQEVLMMGKKVVKIKWKTPKTCTLVHRYAGIQMRAAKRRRKKKYNFIFEVGEVTPNPPKICELR